MKKSALMIPVGAATAALLLIASAAKYRQAAHQPDPYAAISWLAAIMAIAVFVVMLAEYFIHGRQVHLYVGGGFLAVGIMGVWDALTFPYDVVFGNLSEPSASTWAYLLLWQLEWITLALILVYGMFRGRRFSSKEQVMSRSVAVGVAAILWAAIVIFVVSNFGYRAAVSGAWVSKSGMISAGACGVIFAIACFGYGRTSIHRKNAVLAWMAYGLVFAVLAQLAMAIREEPSRSLLWFASLMKVLVFLTPLTGMLAEHTRLQVRLRDQASEMNTLIQTQQAVAAIASPADLYQRITDLAAVSLSAVAACLMPFERDRGLLRVAAHVGFDDDVAKRLAFRPGEGPVGDSYSDKELIFIRDVVEDRTLNSKLGALGEIRTGVFAPLIARDECLGVLAIFFGGRPLQKLSKEQSRMLDAIANQAALAVEAAELRGRILDFSKATGGYAQELETVWEIGRAVDPSWSSTPSWTSSPTN